MHIRWTGSEVRELTHICDYIEEHGSAAAARRVNNREVIIPNLPYQVIDRVGEEAVEILRISSLP